MVAAYPINNPAFTANFSVGEIGNHWGRDCSDSFGFRYADELDLGGKTDSPHLGITDSHPFGRSVSGLKVSVEGQVIDEDGNPLSFCH